MIVRLKCVDKIDIHGFESDYLTTGKIYDAIMSKRDEIALLDDYGVLINDNLYEPIHAKWEIIQDDC